MPNAPQQVFSRETEHDSWVATKFSDIIVEFAEPLLNADPDGPADIEALRNMMSLATLCWNAPLREVRGDSSLMKILQPALMAAPEPIATALRQMLASRLSRFAGVPHTIIAEVTGSSLDDARCVARAYAAEEVARGPDMDHSSKATGAGGLRPIALTRILPLTQLFPELAEREQEVWRVAQDESASGLHAGTYILRERYCADKGCDCQRVMLYVEHVEGGRVIATIGYAFEAPKPPYDSFEKQTELDWLNPQSELSTAALARFEQQIGHDAGYRARLRQHYARWKQVVEDRTHPLHVKLGTSVSAARTAPARTSSAKVAVNAPCPCGSGRKYKRCCRS
jgi:hypothetical protein